jgi:TRAP transporter TAXI family solute receptor
MRVLLGRRMIEPNATDTWLSRALVAGVVLLAMLITFNPWNANSNSPRQRLPNTVRLAAGQAGGSYDYVGRVLSQAIEKTIGLPTTPLTTLGSLDNRQRLIEHNVELALLQGSTIKSDELVVVAPLYYEAVHVLVSSALPQVAKIEDLKGLRIIVGPEGSGSRAVAKRILQQHQLDLTDVEPVAADWLAMDGQADIDGAIVVVQVGNARMHELLRSGQYRLLPLQDAVQISLDDPAFRLLPITSEYYPQANLPPGGINTIATTAYLTSHINCPDTLVRKALEAVYSPEVRQACQLLSPERVADWDVHWHRAAKQFYESYRSNK